jgi:hypothetical protein
MLPNMMSYILIAMISAMNSAIYSQTTLVFLGLVPFGNNWGVLFSLAYAKNAIYNPNARACSSMGGIVLRLSLIMFCYGRSVQPPAHPESKPWKPTPANLPTPLSQPDHRIPGQRLCRPCAHQPGYQPQ